VLKSLTATPASKKKGHKKAQTVAAECPGSEEEGVRLPARLFLPKP